MSDILFVGNSFTYTNDIPAMLQSAAAALGRNVDADSVTKGKYTLELFCTPSDPYAQILSEKLRTRKYDYMILQEQSIRPILDYDRFKTYASALVDRARENGATPLLYSTWGFGEGHEKMKENGWDTKTMASLVDKAYTRLGQELGIDVVHCGLVMLSMYQKDPSLPLYAADLKHPGVAGSYLVALTFARQLLGADVRGLDYWPQELSEQQARAVQNEVMLH